jgi:hypothetical protein
MQKNDAEKNSVHLHYSPTFWYSVGYKSEVWRDDNFRFDGAQVNFLLKRWNQKYSQANAYLKLGAGRAEAFDGPSDGKVNAAGFAHFSADWETQRYFTQYSARYTEVGDIDDFFAQSARLGIAPYIGDYGDLHTWTMVQFDHRPEASDDKFTVTPLLRFFKGVNMVEMGISSSGEGLFNWVIRF